MKMKENNLMGMMRTLVGDSGPRREDDELTWTEVERAAQRAYEAVLEQARIDHITGTVEKPEKKYWHCDVCGKRVKRGVVLCKNCVK